ncbi:MAG TPA: Hsp20/alpha crystallin family protein [Actinomycetota bacterium]|nr:Hsp20/alpha crystallin family protein [Actinomycetota bacterium]
MTIAFVRRIPAAQGRRTSGGNPEEVDTMTNLSKWDPFRDLLGIQTEMTRLFDRAYGDNGTGARMWAPPVDIAETPDGYRVVIELPGFGPDQVDVTVTDGALTVKGERKFYTDVAEESFHRVERRFGAFQRTVALPTQVQADRIEASFDNGLLTIDVPKAEAVKPRRIEIKAGR